MSDAPEPSIVNRLTAHHAINGEKSVAQKSDRTVMVRDLHDSIHDLGLLRWDDSFAASRPKQRRQLVLWSWFSFGSP